MQDLPKTPARTTRTRDNFLAEAVRPRGPRLTYGDGFRLGIGIITAQLLIGLLVGGLTWALMVAFKLHI
ncbi:MAG TPA: hypothetical protein VMT30_04855 [Candidatus Saccharimonadia bacterium]|nr:hypothetical protein [Candidatus Saccharimonadia bacterium]